MRILYISNALFPSQTAHSVQIMRMCESFARAGHAVTLLSQAAGTPVDEAVIRRHYDVSADFHIEQTPIERRSFGYYRYLARLRRAIRARADKTDAAYGRFVWGCLFAARSGIPTIFEAHMPVRRASDRIAFSLLIRTRAFKRLVVISNALKEHYAQTWRIPEDRILVAHDAARPVENVRPQSLGGRTTAMKAGYAGSLYEGKGMEVIATVAPQLPEIDFHIVGGRADDIASWKERVLGSNVFFHGHQAQSALPGYIAAFDVALLPLQRIVRPHGSRTDDIGAYTSPLKLFEYMSHGKVVVASDVPVLREVLDESCAVLVAPEDTAGWVAAIQNLAERPEKRAALGEAAKNRFLGHYTWDARAMHAIEGVS